MIQISINQKGARVDTIQKIVEEAIKSKFPDAVVSARRQDPPESRADRFSEFTSLVGEARDGAEELKSELEEWRDGLPENLQSGGKADELETAISELESFIDNCQTAEDANVDFPSMY